MAIRNIVKEGDDILTKVCRPVEKFDDKLGQMLDDMAETMKIADGVGLAAPQIGVLRRAVVVDVGDGVIELVNPKIIQQSGEQRDAEGCLSYDDRILIKEITDKVSKPTMCKVYDDDLTTESHRCV